VCEIGRYTDVVATRECKDCPVGRMLSDAATVASKHDEFLDCNICIQGK
jgi:hypothetical protein